MNFATKLFQSLVALGVAIFLVFEASPPSGAPWAQATGPAAPLEAALLTRQDFTDEYSHDPVSYQLRHGDQGDFVGFELTTPDGVSQSRCAEQAPYLLDIPGTWAKSSRVVDDLPAEFAASWALREEIPPAISIAVNDAYEATDVYSQELRRMIDACAGQGNLASATGETITAQWHDDLMVLTFYHVIDNELVPASLAVRTDSLGAAYILGVNVPERYVADVADTQIQRLGEQTYSDPDFSTPVPGLAQLLGNYLYWNWF